MLARRIATQLQLPHIELDAINWQSEWRDLTRRDPAEFVRRVTEEIRAEAWVLDGNYGPVREPAWRRATHLVWLDYERAVIMTRVISRSFLRAVLRTEMWAGLFGKRPEQADSDHEVNSIAIGGSTY
jgi:adenylate kinase family enzyme